MPHAVRMMNIRALAERAKATGAIDLAQGVLDVSPPSALLEELRQLPVEKLSKYEYRHGVRAYREALQGYLAARGWAVALDSIMATNGAMAALASALLAGARPGQAVLLPEPFFQGHQQLLTTLGFIPRFFPYPIDGVPDWPQLIAAFRLANVAILTSPANPTGHIVPWPVLHELARLAAAEDRLLILDEMYREFIWDEGHPNDAPYQALDVTRTVVVRSWSKTLAIPGWRVGYAISSPAVIEQMIACHDPLYVGGSTVAQHAVARALARRRVEITQYIADVRSLLRGNLEILTEAFRVYGMYPLPVRATYYLMIKHERSSDAAAMEELMAKQIIVTPGNILSSDPTKDTGYLRIHVAVSRETAQAVARQLKL